MEGFDVVRAVVHWVHAIAAVAWVGGSIFYLVVLRPALISASVSNRALEMAINKGFKEVVDISIIALIVSGVFITFDRLSSHPVTSVYYLTLALKLTTVMTMFFMARQLGTRTGRLLRSRTPEPAPRPEPSLRDAPARTSTMRRWLSPSRMILVLGLVTFYISMVLARIYEHNLGNLS